MKLTKRLPGNAAWMGLSLLLALLPLTARAISTTTVQGTLYRADGSIAKGTLLLSWPTFTTAANEPVAAGSKTIAIGSNGWVSVALASNYGATPDGTYYTAVLHLSDGSTSTEYWLVPTTTTADIGGVRVQIMPAYVAARSVNKQYVDTAMAAYSAGLIPATGGSMTGPLTLSSDPVAAQQASTKHYVDQAVTSLLPLSGGALTGPITLAGDPTASTQAATKHYVDTVVMPESQITNLAADLAAKASLASPNFTSPTATADPTTLLGLATKQYVDAHAGADATKVPLAGGAMSGSLTLNADPTSASVALQAATKNFVMNHGEISVTDYGAVGDGVTDNRAAFNAAVLAAKASGKTLFVPAGNYLFSDAVDFRGVTMHGVRGLGGLGTLGSTLIGSMCHDVIATPESADTLLGQVGTDYFAISDFTVLVDASRDATAQFNSVVNTSGTTVTWISGSKFACLINGPGTPTVRINGTTYNVASATDTTITTSTAVGTLTNATLWSAGTFVNRKRWALQRSAFSNNPAAWTGITLGATKAIGAATITLASAPVLNSSWGVAANGAVLIGTNVCNYYGIVGAVLQNVTCGQQGTTDVSGSAGATVTPVNPWLYTDTADDFPGVEVGNVAFAFPQRDADHALNNMTGSFHENIRVLPINITSNQANNNGGWFTQITPYAAHFKNLMARGTTFGFIEAQMAVDIDQEIRGQGTQDAAVFEGFEMHTPVPFVGVSGDFVSINNFQLYSGTYDGVKVPSRGLILLEPTDPNCSGCLFNSMPMGGWNIRNMYNEPGYVGTYYGPYAQIQGGTMQFYGGMMASQPGPIVWDAIGSETHGTSLNSGVVPAMIINGSGNKFHNAGVNNIAGEVVDNSQGGTEWDGMHSYGIKDAFQVPTRFGPANRIDGAFLRTMSTAADTYQSGDGLFLSPENIVNWLNIGTQYIKHDATAPVTGQYLVLPAHPGVDLLGRVNGYDAWHVGTTFPAGTGTIVVKARPAATTGGTLQATKTSGGSIGSASCSLTIAVWSTCSIRYDSTTATIGDQIKIIGAWNGTDNAFSPATEIDVAYVAAIPDFNTINVGTLNAGNIATTNPVVLPGAPSTTNQAANKGYVDTQVATALPLAGGTLAGNLTLVGNPSATNMAANKGYVDSAVSAFATTPQGQFQGGPAAVTGAHSYWRIYSIGQSIRELEFRATVGGATQTTGGTALCSPGIGGNPCSYAFDGNTGNFVYLNDSLFIGYQFASPVNVVEVSINVQSGANAGTSPILQYSDDGSAWYAAKTWSGLVWSDYQTKILDVYTSLNTAPRALVLTDLPAIPYGSLTGTPAIPVGSSTAPLMNGTAAVGSLITYAKADHVHPTDTTRQATLTLTTTGTSGAATLVGGALNIPQYASGMMYPSGTGIAAVSAGAAWGTTLSAPTGTIVGTTDTQTLTNKTVDGVAPATMAFVDATSSIQTQLNAKAPIASPTFTTQATAPKFIGVIAGETDVTYSATPTFVATSNLNYISLTGNVTSSTLAAGANGQTINLVICQDATGSRTFVWPTTVRGGGTIGSAASTCSSQSFTYVGALSKWVSASAMHTGL